MINRAKLGVLFAGFGLRFRSQTISSQRGVKDELTVSLQISLIQFPCRLIIGNGAEQITVLLSGAPSFYILGGGAGLRNRNSRRRIAG